jgi:integrase
MAERKKRRRGENGSVWFRAYTDSWYVRSGGRQVPVLDENGRRVRGRENRKAAQAAWQAMRSKPPASPDEVAEVAEVIRCYVSAKRPGDTKAEKVTRHYLHSFAERWRGLTVAALTPHHVTVWLDGRPSWGSECRWHAITLLSACLNWAQGVLGTRNPIKGMARPARKSRGVEAVIPADVHKALVAGASRHVADVLIALKATGARPGEVLSVTAADFNERAGVWVLAKHKTAHKTGRPRVIALTNELVELCRRLAVRYPTGPLFRSPSGAAWSANAFGCQVRRLRRRLGLQRVFPYCYRHTLATEALTAGVSDSLVSAVLGHADTSVLHHHYQHLTARVQALREVVNRVAGNGG